MDMKAHIAMLEQRAEFEAAELLAESESARGIAVPINTPVDHRYAAAVQRDLATLSEPAVASP